MSVQAATFRTAIKLYLLGDELQARLKEEEEGKALLIGWD